MTNSQKQINELVRDYNGTYNAWENAVKSLNTDQANNLRESLLCMYERIEYLKVTA